MPGRARLGAEQPGVEGDRAFQVGDAQKLLPVVDVTAAVCCEPLAREPLPPTGAEELAPLFKALADPVRLRLLSLIACHDGGESCVCDWLGAFDTTAPSVSYHPKVLGEAGLISSERRGTWVYCRVNLSVLARMSAVLAPSVTPGVAAG